jgi:hypothetical protein
MNWKAPQEHTYLLVNSTREEEEDFSPRFREEALFTRREQQASGERTILQKDIINSEYYHTGNRGIQINRIKLLAIFCVLIISMTLLVGAGWLGHVGNEWACEYIFKTSIQFLTIGYLSMQCNIWYQALLANALGVLFILWCLMITSFVLFLMCLPFVIGIHQYLERRAKRRNETCIPIENISTAIHETL